MNTKNKPVKKIKLKEVTWTTKDSPTKTLTKSLIWASTTKK